MVVSVDVGTHETIRLTKKEAALLNKSKTESVDKYVVCRKCGSDETRKNGHRMLSRPKPRWVQDWQCKRCGHLFY